MIDNAKRKLKIYFTKNRWNAIDVKKGETVFYKNRDPSNIREHEFLEYSKKRDVLQVSDIVNQIRGVFVPRGYKERESEPVVRPKGSSTFFTTSGIQAFERELFSGKAEEAPGCLFIQPVIRTNYIKSVGEGNVSSFVNPSTIRMNCTPDQYIEDLDGWMNVLSGIGLYMGDFVFKLKSNEGDLSSLNPWKRKSGFSLSCSYGGLGLGNAGYYLSPGAETPFEDIGFGLERLLWARNKNTTFRDVVGVLPHAFNQDMGTIDSIRSLSLMSMSDINSNEDAKNQFRKYLLAMDPDCSDIESQFSSNYQTWKQFITPQRTEGEAISYLMENMNEIKNRKGLKRVGIPKVPKELMGKISHDENTFIRELIRLKPDLSSSIKQAYKKK